MSGTTHFYNGLELSQSCFDDALKAMVSFKSPLDSNLGFNPFTIEVCFSSMS